MRYHTFNAHVLDDALDQMFTSTATPKSNNEKNKVAVTEGSQTRLQRRVSPPVVQPVDSSGTPNHKPRPIPARRQSIDAAQLARHKLSPSAPGNSASTSEASDLRDKKIDSTNSEAWRYREWPPNADHLETRLFFPTDEIDSPPIPPPRRMSACVGALVQPQLSGAVFQPASVSSNNSASGTVSDARCKPSNREQPTASAPVSNDSRSYLIFLQL